MSALTVRTRDAEGTRAVATALAGVLRAGDLLVLDGPLGAGKTTFTQGLGEGLGVRGPVASPTFVIERVHPNPGEGPDLVHVDAYRLGGEGEIDDLDLEADLDLAVTVVEWGRDRVEHLADSALLVVLDRPDQVDDPEDPDEPRTLHLIPSGPRWDERAITQLEDALGPVTDVHGNAGTREAAEIADPTTAAPTARPAEENR